jgi:chemotaxis protein methyltransferase CheR
MARSSPSPTRQAPWRSSLFEALPGVSPSVYGEKDFLAMAQMMRAEAGIMLPPGKAILVYSRLAPLVRASNLGTFAAYIVMIGKNAEERRKAVCALTTNHTFFYREAHHFDHFTQEVRPQLVEALDAARRCACGRQAVRAARRSFRWPWPCWGPTAARGAVWPGWTCAFWAATSPTRR